MAPQLVLLVLFLSSVKTLELHQPGENLLFQKFSLLLHRLGGQGGLVVVVCEDDGGVLGGGLDSWVMASPEQLKDLAKTGDAWIKVNVNTFLVIS